MKNNITLMKLVFDTLDTLTEKEINDLIKGKANLQINYKQSGMNKSNLYKPDKVITNKQHELSPLTRVVNNTPKNVELNDTSKLNNVSENNSLYNEIIENLNNFDNDVDATKYLKDFGRQLKKSDLTTICDMINIPKNSSDKKDVLIKKIVNYSVVTRLTHSAIANMSLE